MTKKSRLVVVIQSKVGRFRSVPKLLSECRQGSGGADPCHAMYDKKLNLILSLDRIHLISPKSAHCEICLESGSIKERWLSQHLT